MADFGICKIENCGKAVATRSSGLCRMHYQRRYLHGDPMKGAKQPAKTQIFVFEIAMKHTADNCLIWPFSTVGRGYARVSIGGKMILVTRILCEEKYGPPPSETHQAAHNCGNGHLGCVNPNHLRWATPAENGKDTRMHGRRRKSRLAA